MKAPDKKILVFSNKKKALVFIFCPIVTGTFFYPIVYFSKIANNDGSFWGLVLSLTVTTMCIPMRSFKMAVAKWMLLAGFLFYLTLLIGIDPFFVSLPVVAVINLMAYGYQKYFLKTSSPPLLKKISKPPKPEGPDAGLNTEGKVLIGLLLVLVSAMVLSKILNHYNLEQTAALFIGIPLLLAIGFSLIPAETPTGLTTKWTMVALMLSGPVLKEGFICIIMASPLILGFAAMVGALFEHTEEDGSMRSYLILLLLPMAFEGTTDGFSFDRNETVVVEREVALTARQIEWRLANAPFIEKPLPLFLQLGFPVPTEVSGTGLEPGATRQVWFEGSKRSGALVMELESRGGNFVFFKKVKDDSHIAHWMSWESNRTEWTKTSQGTYRVKSTIRFRRELDPYWYFAPLQRFAVGLAGKHFLETYLG